MTELVETEEFFGWLSSLRDSKARTRVQTRLDRLALGNPGDVKSVGPGVSEMRIDYGPGYRVYFCRRGKLVIVLLAGGDKRTQKKDIARAIALLVLMRNEDGEDKN
jgi:putative addiction module killer protein